MVLLEWGSKIGQRDKLGQTAIDTARLRGDVKVAMYLTEVVQEGQLEEQRAVQAASVRQRVQKAEQERRAKQDAAAEEIVKVKADCRKRLEQSRKPPPPPRPKGKTFRELSVFAKPNAIALEKFIS